MPLRDLIFRRLIETGQFVFNVSGRGGMRVDGVWGEDHAAGAADACGDPASDSDAT